MTYFTARSNLVIEALLWKKVKTVDLSETIAACDLEVGRCRQLIEIIEVISLPYIFQVLYVLCFHYENMPMQHKAIFTALKITIFR